MKKAAKILNIVNLVLTSPGVILGVVLATLLILLCPVPLIISIVMVTTQKFEWVIILEGAFASIIIFIAFIGTVITLVLTAGKIVLLAICIKAIGKAKNKKQLIFPMVINFVFAGYNLFKQRYLMMIINLVPGVLLAVSKPEKTTEVK